MWWSSRVLQHPVRRAALALACVVTLGVSSPLHAEPEGRRDRTYMVQLALTLEGARRLMLWVETHPNDPDFARFAYPLAERYVEMAGHMTPSKKLTAAHPHLLLVVENVERALEAAGQGDLAVFRQRMRTVREELSILDNVLKQLKLKLPELSR
jgi:hypothetical protein